MASKTFFMKSPYNENLFWINFAKMHFLAERDEKQRQIIDERLEKRLAKDEKYTEDKINKIRKGKTNINHFWKITFIFSDHIVQTRSLQITRDALDNEIGRIGRDIVADYTFYDSEVYAPIARHGVFPDRGSEQYNVRSKYLDTYQVKSLLVYNITFEIKWSFAISTPFIKTI